MAQQRDDEPGADPVTLVRARQRGVHALERLRRGDTTRRMRLEVEEDLGPADAGAGRACEVRVGEVGEVLAALQDLHVGVVEIQELLQVAEVVPRSQVLDSRIGQADAVAPCQREDQLWLEGPREVYVQLRPRGHRQPPTSCVRSSSTVIALLAWRR